MTAFIIEDIKPAADTLYSLVGSNHIIKEVQIYNTCKKAITAINSLKPDILFIDIHLGQESGFEILNQCIGQYSYVIFTTAFDQYMLKSFDYNTIQYLLKPIFKEDVDKALKKIEDLQENKNQKDLVQKGSNKKIFFKVNKDWIALDVMQIVCLKADGSYTLIVTENDEYRVSTNLLNSSKEIINHEKIFKIQKSYIINTTYIKTIKKGLKSSVVLSNGMSLPISNKIKKEFFELIGM